MKLGHSGELASMTLSLGRNGRCIGCYEPVRVHKTGTKDKPAAHIEHLNHNPKCSLSDRRYSETYFWVLLYLPMYSAFATMWDFIESSKSLRLTILALPRAME